MFPVYCPDASGIAVRMCRNTQYANSIPFSVWKSIPGKYLKQDFEAHGFTYEKLKEYWAVMVPSNFKTVIPKEKILLISGIYDEYVLLENTTHSYGKHGTSLRGFFYTVAILASFFVKEKYAKPHWIF